MLRPVVALPIVGIALCVSVPVIACLQRLRHDAQKILEPRRACETPVVVARTPIQRNIRLDGSIHSIEVDANCFALGLSSLLRRAKALHRKKIVMSGDVDVTIPQVPAGDIDETFSIGSNHCC